MVLGWEGIDIKTVGTGKGARFQGRRVLTLKLNSRD